MGRNDMYKTIVLDCQAGTVNFCCEDCIAFKKCTIDKKNRKRKAEAEAEKANDIEVYVSHI